MKKETAVPLKKQCQECQKYEEMGELWKFCEIMRTKLNTNFYYESLYFLDIGDTKRVSKGIVLLVSEEQLDEIQQKVLSKQSSTSANSFWN